MEARTPLVSSSAELARNRNKLPDHLVFDLPVGPCPPPLEITGITIDMAEANFRPFIDATRDKWPTQEERLQNKNPEPFVMD